MKLRAGKRAGLLLGAVLLLAVVIAGFGRLLGPMVAPAPLPPAAAALPGWQGEDGDARDARPASLSAAELEAFAAARGARSASDAAARLTLALKEQRLLGPAGALALLQSQELRTDPDARARVVDAVAAAASAAARRDDFTAAAALLAALGTGVDAPPVQAARATLARRQDAALADPARTARLTGLLNLARQELALATPAALSSALVALREVALLDPEHLQAEELGADVVAAALAGWRAALESGSADSASIWLDWSQQHLSAEAAADLSAAARAASDRALHPDPTAP